MCLRARKFTPFLITIFPKTVYKILAIRAGELYTPFADKEVETDMLKAKGHIEIYRYPHQKHIHAGMIHSMVDKDDAFELANILKRQIKSANFVIYRALIPPFTLYIKGWDGDIASRKIKLIETIE